MCVRIELDFMFDDLATLKYSNDALRRLLGPLGALKRKIEEETGLIQPCECFAHSFSN